MKHFSVRLFLLAFLAFNKKKYILGVKIAVTDAEAQAMNEGGSDLNSIEK